MPNLKRNQFQTYIVVYMIASVKVVPKKAYKTIDVSTLVVLHHGNCSQSVSGMFSAIFGSRMMF